MFRDEGTRPSIEFKQRMRERVGRTPTSLVLLALPFLLVARAALVARDRYVRVRCGTLARRITANADLRTTARR